MNQHAPTVGRPATYQDGLDAPEHMVAELMSPFDKVPHLAGWRREGMPAVPGAARFDLAPDWICGVLSPGTRAVDHTDRRRIYGAAGVAHLWFVDPVALWPD